MQNTKKTYIAPVTMILIAINCIVYILTMIPGVGTFAINQLAVSPECIFVDGRIYTLVTAMFLHGGLMHIACNMLSLYFVGVFCEQAFGKVKYLILYFSTGIIGNIVFVLGHLSNMEVYAVGASGAIFGLFGAYAFVIFMEHRKNVLLVQKPQTSDLSTIVVIFVLNLAIGLAPGSNIANEAHIGGFVSGIIMGIIFYYTHPRMKAAKTTEQVIREARATNMRNSENTGTPTQNAMPAPPNQDEMYFQYPTPLDQETQHPCIR